MEISTKHLDELADAAVDICECFWLEIHLQAVQEYTEASVVCI